MRWPRRSRDGEESRLLAPGEVGSRIDDAVLDERLAALGAAGTDARTLDAAVEDAVRADPAPFSDLTAGLAEAYLERIGRPLKHLGFEAGADLTLRGYVAHRLVEADPAAYGASDVPVLGTLPPSPPKDLLTRVVRATRRGFERIRAVDAGTWDGLVVLTTWRAHERGAAGDAGEDRYLDPRVVDGLLRFGWVLRQVDLAYGAAAPS